MKLSTNESAAISEPGHISSRIYIVVGEVTALCWVEGGGGGGGGDGGGGGVCWVSGGGWGFDDPHW